MAFIQNRQNGQNFAENLADPLLLFSEGTWTIASGTGSALINTNEYYAGDGSLRVQNNTPASSITATNSVQSSVVGIDGTYQVSFYVKKDIALEVREGAILIYQNAVLLNTQTFSIGSAVADDDINDEWVRIVSDTPYTLTKGDDITFQFRIDASGTAELTTFLFFDAVMLNLNERRNVMPPSYVSPKQVGLYNIYTGWADYVDGTYTTSSPFTVVDGAAVVDLPNDASGGVTSQTPIDITAFYDGTVITGRNGDGINLTFEFKCRPSGVGANPRLTISIDIGGAVGEIYVRDFFLNKGNGIEHNFLSSFDAYTLGTWEANGGTVKVRATNEDIEIYDIRYVITRTHKAR